MNVIPIRHRTERDLATAIHPSGTFDRSLVIKTYRLLFLLLIASVLILNSLLALHANSLQSFALCFIRLDECRDLRVNRVCAEYRAPIGSENSPCLSSS